MALSEEIVGVRIEQNIKVMRIIDEKRLQSLRNCYDDLPLKELRSDY